MSATEDLFGDVEADEHADWSTGTIAPENIDFSKYDLLFFAFATPLLARRIAPTVTRMFLSEIHWDTFPPGYYTYIKQFKNVTLLELVNIVFHSPADIVRLLWSLPALTQLECGLNQFRQQSALAACNRLMEVKRQEACSKLVHLALWVSKLNLFSACD